MLNHVLIIPDGNRRYAKAKNIDLNVVYKYISDDITTKLIKYLIIDKKISEMSFFAISRANVVKRSREDLKGIFEAQVGAYDNWSKNKALTDHIRFRFIGDMSILPKDYRAKAMELEEKTKNNTNGICNLLVAYDGNWELDNAYKSAFEAKDRSNDALKRHLLLKTPIDLVIRTGGEKRYSGAPIYQAEYAELFFLDKFYPELTVEEMEKIFAEYGNRERRFGK